MTKVCPVCGKEFDAKPCGGGRPQRWCSPRCRNIYHCRAHETRRRGGAVGPDGRTAGRVPIAKLTCPVCGREFKPNPSRPQQKYCSRECTNKAWADTLKAARLAARKDRVCPVCGVTFTPKNNQGVYCSKDCYRKAHWLQHKRELPETVKCEHCGREFQPKTSRARYCSRRCNETAVRRRRGIKPLATKTCLACGRSFETRGHRQLYCPDCKVKSATTSPLNRAAPFKGLNRSDLSAEKVSEYLALPAAERWARRGTLSQAELKMAEKMWNQMHSLRMV